MDTEKRGPDTQPDTQIVVECQGLWKVFGNRSKDAMRAVLDDGLGKAAVFERYGCVLGVVDASFCVREGEIFCIMGLSGSGKSTLLRHINRLIEPTVGSVVVNGVNVNELNKSALRRLRAERIGMVFQHMALWPHRTVRDNVAYGLEVRKLDRKTRYAAADEALAKVKLDGWQDRYPDELSGGMQQRVGLARALAADPQILLMDEPFSALDPLIRRDLQDEFLALSAQMRKTTLFITHDLDEAMRVGDRVAIMKDGVIVQIGSPAEIVTRPADDYVAKFVSGISTFGILRAEDAMTAVPPDYSGEGASADRAVTPETGVDRILDLLASSEEPVPVLAEGRCVGLVTLASMLACIRRQMA